jgi:hypothetical protein
VLSWDLATIAMLVKVEHEIGPVQTTICFLAGAILAILFSLTFIR